MTLPPLLVKLLPAYVASLSYFPVVQLLRFSHHRLSVIFCRSLKGISENKNAAQTLDDLLLLHNELRGPFETEYGTWRGTALLLSDLGIKLAAMEEEGGVPSPWPYMNFAD